MKEDNDLIETTDDDFMLFKEECERWIEIYGLKHWDVYFRHEECEGVYGQCESNLTGRVVTIRFAKMWPQRDYSPENIRGTAFHEATELLLAPADALANCRYTLQEELSGAFHSIVRTLEYVLYPKYRGVK
jgi:hypothetical protein